MTRKLHPSARTNPRLRREIRQSGESNRALASRLGLNRKTIAKWKRRRTTSDARMGPKNPVSTVLTPVEEALIVVFRKRTRFPLNDCLARLKPMIPNLSRSALHRCLKRYGVSRVPKGQREKAPQVGDWHSRHFFMEIHALPDEMGGSHLYFAFSDLFTFVFAQQMDGVSVWAAADFLEALIKHAPVKIMSIETNDHEPFIDSPERPWNPENPLRKHPFRKACQENKISHLHPESTNPAPKTVSKGWRGFI
jgi:transposase